MQNAGVCISTLQFGCIPSSDGDDDDDIFLGPFELFSHALHTFNTKLAPNRYLSAKNIVPSRTRTYRRSRLLDILRLGSGVYPYVSGEHLPCSVSLVLVLKCMNSASSNAMETS